MLASSPRSLMSLFVPGERHTLFSGALITETMFAYLGMGKLIYDAGPPARRGGARAIVLSNQKGAVLELSGRQVGLMANADLSGLAISMK